MSIETVYQENLALETEIKQLREVNESISVCKDHTWEIQAFDGCLVCEVERLRARVDELERMYADVKSALDEKSAAVFRPYHTTPEMIDAAVEEASLHGGWHILNKLHIFRCEGCATHGIFGIQGNTDPNTGEDMGPCPDCNGKGWKFERRG